MAKSRNIKGKIECLKQYIIEKKRLNPKRFKTKGFGESDPDQKE